MTMTWVSVLVQCCEIKRDRKKSVTAACKYFRDLTKSRNLTWSSQSSLQIWQQTVFRDNFTRLLTRTGVLIELFDQSTNVQSRECLPRIRKFFRHLPTLQFSCHFHLSSSNTQSILITIVDHLNRANVMRENSFMPYAITRTIASSCA